LKEITAGMDHFLVKDAVEERRRWVTESQSFIDEFPGGPPFEEIAAVSEGVKQ